MLEIYRYSQASQFVRDAWAAKKKKNKSFSLRAWSRQLGFVNNAPLSLMLAGKRSIPKKYIPKLIASLDLSPDEGLFFETLVEMEKSKDLRQKSFYQERLKALSPMSPIEWHEIETFKYIENPLHTILLEMSELKDFRPDASWIQKRLQTNVSIAEINEVIERLLSLGLLEKEKSGHLKKGQKNLSSRLDISDQGVQEYHQNISRIAAEQIKLQDVLEREFNGYSINIRKSDIPEAKKLIRKFINNFAQRLEAAPGTGEETYQLNVQFFGLTKKGEHP
jgi:uncharacterized protein (TIGR02147 family)